MTPSVFRQHRTNLTPISGFVSTPCVDPRHLENYNLSSEPLVVIDYEHDEKNIERGDKDARARAREVFRSFHKATSRFTKLGWYWWPPCYRKWAEPAVAHYESLCSMADFLAPSFYACTDDPTDVMIGCKYWCKAVSSYSPSIRKLPRIGFVCPVQAFSGRQCSEREIRLQVEACRTANCTAMYVWSGEPAMVNALLSDSIASHVLLERQKALATLLGRGYVIDYPITREALEKQLAIHSRAAIEVFGAEWERTA